MGQVFSLMSSFWESFSLPYKAAVVASFILWLHSQRKKFPAIFVFAVLAIIKTIAKRLVGIKMHPKYSLRTELGVAILRDVMENVEAKELTKFQVWTAGIAPKHYPVREVRTSKFTAHWYGSEDPNAKVYYFIHGGGYIFGTSLGFVESFSVILKALEKRGVKAAVFSLDYLLAPEYPFPTQIHQAVAGYEYLLNNLSISPNRIIVGGDSAGGALTLAMSYQIRESLPPPAALVLNSPWVDSRNCERFANNPNLATDYIPFSQITDAARKYMQKQQHNHLSSPLIGNTQGLPLIFLTYGGLELLKDDIAAFADKVKMENGEDKIVIDEHPSMPHDYSNLIEMFGQPAVDLNLRIADFMESVYKKYD